MYGLRAGLVHISINAKEFDVVGNIDMNLGKPKRTAKIGANKVHGYTETPQAPGAKAVFTVPDISISISDELLDMKDATVIVETAEGRSYTFGNAVYSGDGSISTENGEVQFEFTSETGLEVR